MEKGYTIPCLDHGFVRFIDHMGTDQRIVEAARLSYKSPSKGDEADKKLLNYLWRNRHTSPFEQCSITYNIKLPLFVQAQLVRHRTQRLNQLSARYTEMVDEFYIPTEWRRQDTKNKQGSLLDEKWNPPLLFKHISEAGTATGEVTIHCEESYRLYTKMLEAGIAKEMSRMILPQNLYTEIYSNWDLNNLLKMFALRLDEHAQYEIRIVVGAMYQIMKELFPWTHEAYTKYKWVLQEHD